MLRRRLVPLALIAVWLLTPRADSAARGIPGKLDDAAFWRLVETSSEPGGSFPSDNFVSNELLFQTVIPRLTTAVKPGGVYIGVGPDQNFTYIAALRPKIAFIVDIRRGNLLQHLLYKAVIELSPTRADFLARLFSVTKPADAGAGITATALIDAFAGRTSSTEQFETNFREIVDRLERVHRFALSDEDEAGLSYIYRTFARFGPSISYASPAGSLMPFPPGQTMVINSPYPTYGELMTATDGQGVNRAYLASDDNYRVLRDMHARNLIVPVVGDFAGDKALKAIGAYIRERGATVSVFYTSNVEQYLFQNNVWHEYYDNVASLPLDPGALFIRAYFPCNVARTVTTRFGNGCAMLPNIPPSALAMRLPSATLLAPIKGDLTAVKSGSVQQYFDLVELSK